MSGYSRQQLTRLIKQYKEHRWIGRVSSPKHCFATKYTRVDILLLAKTDEYHNTLSGAATKKLFERGYIIYKDLSYERLSNISIAHIYNLRKSFLYKDKRQVFTKTNPRNVAIGERRKPTPNGQPGYIRIDTVHQGDQDKQKGVYHINAVDEITQFEVVCSVETISENNLMPILEALLAAFPFKLINFHSDNGSEYINKTVAKLLNKLHIKFTKSRARHSNDNALAECKNGAIVRKHLGYVHIPQKWAPLINKFNQAFLVPYINFHRPCFFVVIETDIKGKEIKKYPYNQMMTPYEKLKSLPNAQAYLKEGVSFESLDNEAMAITDLECAKQLNKARTELFNKIFQNPPEL